MNAIALFGHFANRATIPMFIILGSMGWISKLLGPSQVVPSLVLALYLCGLAAHLLVHNSRPCPLCIDQMTHYNVARAARRAWAFGASHWIMHASGSIPWRLIGAGVVAFLLNLALTNSLPEMGGAVWLFVVVLPAALLIWIQDQHRLLRYWCLTCNPGEGGGGGGAPEGIDPKDPSLRR